MSGGVSFGSVHDAASAHAAFKAWLFGRALPFWGTAGMDAAPGQPSRGAQESLRLDGAPSGLPYKRMRVQARQIYAFSQAALLGWPAGEALARDAYRFIIGQGELDGGGWARRLAPDGALLDPAVDLYDQAFVLFALAWYARLTGEDEPLVRARRTAGWIEAQMAQPPAGFHEVLPQEPGPRRQNPHMHLLEAVLALHETSGDPYYAGFAHRLVDLFHRHLFDAGTGTLGEFFAEDWTPAPGEAGTWVEPGHHYEWVWLLDQYERLTGADAAGPIGRLYGFARRHGTDPATALVWDAVARDGTVLQRSLRLWPQTEALKAHATMARRGGPLAQGAASLIAPTVRNLGTRFLAREPAGSWMDQFDAAGAPASDKVPTSSFYHVVMGYAELDRWAGSAPPELPGTRPSLIVP